MTQPQSAPSIIDTPPSKKRRRVFWLAVGLLAVLLVVVARPVWHVIATAKNDVDELEALPAGFVDDASRMNRTEEREVWEIPKGQEEAEKQLSLCCCAIVRAR